MTVSVPERAATGQAIRRLLADYVGRQWGLLALAILCMLFTSAMGGGIPWLVNNVTKQVFMRHQADMLLPLSLLAFGIMALRAASLFFGRMLIDSLGEKAVAKAQADMFGRLIRRDLADLNAVHSGQFVSNFLYDATLMRDALTQGVAAIFLELVQLLVYIGIVLASDWQLGLISLLALPGVAWAMERLGGSMRRAATRGMNETGDLAVALSEAMDGRRIIKAYGLEAHVIRRVDSRLAARLKTLLGRGPAARRRRAADGYLRRPDHRLCAVFRRLADSARSAHPQYLLRLSHRPAAGAAAGPQSKPALADRFGRHRRRQSHVRRHRCEAPHRQYAGRGRAQSPRAMAAPSLSTMSDFPMATVRSWTGSRSISPPAAKSRWWGRRARARAPSSICCCVSTSAMAG